MYILSENKYTSDNSVLVTLLVEAVIRAADLVAPSGKEILY
jgi:hypothetical protein